MALPSSDSNSSAAATDDNEKKNDAAATYAVTAEKDEIDSLRTSQVPHPLLAVGSYDGNVRLLSTRSWAVAYVLPSVHPTDMSSVLSHGVVTTVEVTGGDATVPMDVSTTAATDVFSSFSSKANPSRYVFSLRSFFAST